MTVRAYALCLLLGGTAFSSAAAQTATAVTLSVAGE